MNRRLIPCLLAFTVIAMLGSWYSSTQTSADSAVAGSSAMSPQAKCNNPAAKIPLTGKTCGKVQDLQLSCYLPSDLVPPLQVSPTPKPSTNFNVTQRSADIFSWQEFIALNWPALAGSRGEPDPDKKIGDPGPRVWETWKEEYEVYRPDGF